MSFNYYEYLKYKLILQMRRRFSSIQKILNKFSPHISYNKLLLICFLKYIFEVTAVATASYTIFKNIDSSTKMIIFVFLIIYLIIYTTKVFVNNYNKIFQPEDGDFLKIFPIEDFKRKILLYISTFLSCLIQSVFKRIFQLYLPCIFIFREIKILNALLGIIIMLFFSFYLAIIYMHIKFFISKNKISLFKLIIYILSNFIIYKFIKKVTYYIIIFFNTFPYTALKNKNAECIDYWINTTYISVKENVMFYINTYLFNKYSPVLNLKQFIFGERILLNILFLLMCMISLHFIFVLLLKKSRKYYDKNYFKGNKDIISSFINYIALIITKFNKVLCAGESSIYNIAMKDLKIMNNTREFVNPRFFDIFGGFIIWILLGFLSGIEQGLVSINNLSYMKYFKMIIIFFVPVFVSLNLHEKIKDSFKFIFLVDGENRNINLYKITGYPMKNLIRSKKIIFFIFSSLIYLILLISYFILFKLNSREYVMVIFNFICIYYFSCNFYLIGPLFNTDFSWNHVDDLGNNIGQKFLSNSVINAFEFFYVLFLGVLSIFYIASFSKIIILLYVLAYVSLYYITKYLFKKALLQINDAIYCKDA